MKWNFARWMDSSVICFIILNLNTSVHLKKILSEVYLIFVLIFIKYGCIVSIFYKLKSGYHKFQIVHKVVILTFFEFSEFFYKNLVY